MSMFGLLRIVYFGCLAATCVIGFRRGGIDEKAGALVILAASLLTVLVQRPSSFDWRYDRLALVAVDLVALLAFSILALRSRRFWPLWATAFHLIAMCTHLVINLEPHSILQAYALLQGFWAYPIMGSIILGCLVPAPPRTGAIAPTRSPNSGASRPR